MKTFLFLTATLLTAHAWSPNPFSSNNMNPSRRSILILDDDVDTENEKQQTEQAQETRRRFLNAAAMNVCMFGAAAPALAADGGGPTKYISGKAPIVPGGKPVDKSNTKGTRKDPDFLRSIADCRNQCQNSGLGPDGFTKSKEDCLSECQDICCKTYEQCTFNIVPRI